MQEFNKGVYDYIIATDETSTDQGSDSEEEQKEEEVEEEENKEECNLVSNFITFERCFFNEL